MKKKSLKKEGKQFKNTKKGKKVEKMEEQMVNIKIIKGKTWISKWDE